MPGRRRAVYATGCSVAHEKRDGRRLPGQLAAVPQRLARATGTAIRRTAAPSSRPPTANRATASHARSGMVAPMSAVTDSPVLPFGCITTMVQVPPAGRQVSVWVLGPDTWAVQIGVLIGSVLGAAPASWR